MTEQMKKAMLAGALIAIGALFSMAAVRYGNVLQGFCFSVGLFGVLSCNARLFTGQVLMVQDVWDGRMPVTAMLGHWARTWTFNLIGAVAVALVAHFAGMGTLPTTWTKTLAPANVLLFRAVLCNVLVCMAVWCYRRTSGGPAEAMVSALLPVMCFVACGFEHSVANMFYMALSAIEGLIDIGGFAYVVGVTTLGNVIGGLAFSWLVHKRRA